MIRNQPVQAEFRRLFGDERIDYAEALERHYREGPDPNWQQTHVSAYASSHPWEDWAETWAHYLHMLDTLETAHQLGLSLQPRISDEQPVEIEHDRNAYHQSRFQWLIERWLPLTYAMNNLNRSMGHPGAYPFELKPTAIGKLAFVHKVIRGAAGNGSTDRRTRA